MFFSGNLKTTSSEQSGKQAASTGQAKLIFDSKGIPEKELHLLKLFLTNLGKINTPISFSLILSLPLSHNPSLMKASLISPPGTARHLQMTSLATLHRNHKC